MRRVDPRESELITRCRGGEPEAWDALFDAHYAGTVRFLFQLSTELTHEDAEELAQEVFLSAIQNLRHFRGHCRIQTWLFHIAINKFRDFHQRRAALKRGAGKPVISLDAESASDREDGAPPIPVAIDPGPDPALSAMRNEQQDLLTVALETLGDPCREILELRFFGESSYEDIGRALRLNVKTVSSRLSRCLGRLEAIGRELIGGSISSRTPSNSVGTRTTR